MKLRGAGIERETERGAEESDIKNKVPRRWL